MNMNCMYNTVSAEPFLKPVVAENDILTLQDILLTNGLHYVQANQAMELRTVIIKFLSSLNYYSSIVFLSVDMKQDDLPEYIETIALASHYLDNAELLQQFILNELSCDFLWIEADDSFELFVDQLITMGVHTQMPILICSR